jgi:hypothetical protein
MIMTRLPESYRTFLQCTNGQGGTRCDLVGEAFFVDDFSRLLPCHMFSVEDVANTHQIYHSHIDYYARILRDVEGIDPVAHLIQGGTRCAPEVRLRYGNEYGWIPIGGHIYGQGTLIMDMEPAEIGAVGQILYYELMRVGYIIDGFHSYLQEAVLMLEAFPEDPSERPFQSVPAYTAAIVAGSTPPLY